jgi:hypothetical protein
MRLRAFAVPAATVGLWLGHACPSFATPPGQPPEPGRLSVEPGPAVAQPSANQQLANTIAGQLRASAQLRQFNVDIQVVAGNVELTGQVSCQVQHDEVLRIVQGVPGVEKVVDRLTIVNNAVTPVAGITQPAIGEPRPLPTNQPEAVAPPGGGPSPSEPMPIFRCPPGADGPNGGGMPPPPMPPYSWPTYAPYNNYSRVAYPTLYPYQSWPFIGPMYPFPKVPLGWRSITLRWVDGHWWYGRTATGHDWWRVRYW